MTDLARLIDHTLLRPDATAADVAATCAEARQYGFAMVCLNPVWVAHAAGLLVGSPVGVCSVIGFPFGASRPDIKAAEAAAARADGAREIDMVILLGALKGGDRDAARADIAAVRAAISGATLKVIIETAMLDDHLKTLACEIAVAAGADFVKTSTGYGGGGATLHDVALMRRIVGPSIGVKASGGIRDRATAEAMVAAGATRLGCSASVAIVGGGAAAGSY